MIGAVLAVVWRRGERSLIHATPDGCGIGQVSQFGTAGVSSPVTEYTHSSNEMTTHKCWEPHRISGLSPIMAGTVHNPLDSAAKASAVRLNDCYCEFSQDETGKCNYGGRNIVSWSTMIPYWPK